MHFVSKGKSHPTTRNRQSAQKRFVPSTLTTSILAVCLTVTLAAGKQTFGQTVSRHSPASSVSYTFTNQDQTFLDALEKRSFEYFWEQADPQTGLVPDRARTDASPLDENHRNVGSIAATGFGLTALCIAAERGWIKREEARERTRNTLRFFADRAYQQHGWFYHWLDIKTGERRWSSEVSSIDTALLLAGVLTTRKYFSDDREIYDLATRIYQRVDFPWMLNGADLLSHGWKPESGFLKSRWDTYSEDTILYLLAIGSPTHPIPARSWYKLWRDRYRYEGYSYFTTIGVPLFMHQYAHAWIDFRNRRERYGVDRIDYFENSVNATLAHRAFCKNLSYEFKHFNDDVWGITASDSANGYVAWGGPPRDPDIDGTLVPAAAGGSLMFTPELSLKSLRAMQDVYGEKIYGRYGFVDAFNPATGWIDTDVIGINQGIILLSAENARTGNVWRWFMTNVEMPRAMAKIGLTKYRIGAEVRDGGRPFFERSSRISEQAGETSGIPTRRVQAQAGLRSAFALTARRLVHPAQAAVRRLVQLL